MAWFMFPARLSSVQVSSAQVSSAQLGSGQLGSARLGSARLGSGQLGSARLGSGQLSSARLGSARLGSARLGSAQVAGFCSIIQWIRSFLRSFCVSCTASHMLLYITTTRTEGELTHQIVLITSSDFSIRACHSQKFYQQLTIHRLPVAVGVSALH